MSRRGRETTVRGLTGVSHQPPTASRQRLPGSIKIPQPLRSPSPSTPQSLNPSLPQSVRPSNPAASGSGGQSKFLAPLTIYHSPLTDLCNPEVSSRILIGMCALLSRGGCCAATEAGADAT